MLIRLILGKMQFNNASGDFKREDDRLCDFAVEEELEDLK